MGVAKGHATEKARARSSSHVSDQARFSDADYSSTIEQFGYYASVLELSQEDGTIMTSACDLAAIRA